MINDNVIINVKFVSLLMLTVEDQFLLEMDFS